MRKINTFPIRPTESMPAATSASYGSHQQLLSQKPTPIDIVFHNIIYSKITKHKQSTLCHPLKYHKHIISGVSGIVKHGKITAIMGASGAGKTTLLNILAQRIKPTRNFHL